MDHQAIIEQLLNTKTREWIIDYISQYDAELDWSEGTTRDILETISESDVSAGEDDNGILASMYQEA